MKSKFLPSTLIASVKDALDRTRVPARNGCTAAVLVPGRKEGGLTQDSVGVDEEVGTDYGYQEKNRDEGLVAY